MRLAAAQLILCVASASAQSINIPSIGVSGRVGPPGVPLVGQTFVAPAQYLTDFAFTLTGGAGQFYTANIGTWTGTAVGSLLWTSSSFEGNAGDYSTVADLQTYSFSPGGLSLVTGGQTYIAFLNWVSGTGTWASAGWNGDVYGSGQLVFSFDPDASNAWNLGLSNIDMGFVANFSDTPPNVVPEPATMTLLATGLAGMAAARRKKRKV